MCPRSDRPSDYAGPIEAEEPAADQVPTPPTLNPIEFARWIWRQLTSMRTALILLFMLAVAAIPGSLIPQQKVSPSEVLAFKQNHPNLTPVFEKIGAFSVYSSVWFSAIYILLMVSLLGCIVPRLRVYLRNVRARPPKAPRNLSRFSAYGNWASDDDLEAEAAKVSALLKRQRRRVEVYRNDDEIVVSAEKGYLREAGNLLFHFALLVVLVGVAFTSLYGFKGSAAVIVGNGFSNGLTQYDDFSPGARFNPSSLAPFSFTVKDFDVSFKQSGAGEGTPLNFDADLSVTNEPGATPYDYDLRVNHPLELDGTSVFLVGHGYAPIVTVRDGDGNITYSGPKVFLPQDGSFLSYGVLKFPDAQPKQLGFEGYFFPTAAITPGGQPYSSFPDANNPVLSLIAYTGDLGLDDGVPQSVYSLDKDKLTPFTMGNGKPEALLLKVGDRVKLPDGAGSISFDGYQRWVKLQISHAPAKVVPLAGVWAMIIGLLGSLFIRPRRTWVRLRRSDGRTVVEVAALDRASGGDPAAHVVDVVKALAPPRDGIEAGEETQ